MRIAMIGQKGMPAIFGGVERHTQELSVRLVKFGHQVTVYSRPWYTQKKSKKIKGVDIKLLPSIHTKHLDTITHSFLATLDAVRRKNKFDIIHYHGVGPTLFAWIPRLFTPRIKVIATFHSIDRKHRKWGLVARLVLKLAERAACYIPHETIVVSQTIAQYVRDVYDKDAVFIPNAVPDYPKNKKTDRLKKWELAPESYLLAVSRLIPHKGIHYIITAYKKLQKIRPKLLKNTPLVIVGDGYYTEKYVEELKSIAKGSDQIIFTGFQTGEDLDQLYSHARLMIHASDNEGLPITVLEAMSYELPVLVSDILEHRELIDDKNYNFIRGNTHSLANQLAKLLKSKKGALQKQVKANHQFVKSAYNWEAVVAETIALYESPFPAIKEEALQAA